MILNMEKMTFEKIIGSSEAMRRQIKLAEKASDVDLPVLITGETGTGKELFAKAIHSQSCRREKPYIAENCGAVPRNLAESIFFGTAKGAFTQAETKPGLFELADGGTLLLDELNSMPFELQSKLLRTLQEGSVRRLGGASEIAVDVRIMAALNEDAEMLLNSGKLRRDLYYRLNVIHLEIPPLREHREDIPEYITYFLKKYNEKYDKAFEGLANDAIKELKKRDYPGNVRELENIIEGAVAMGGSGKLIKLKDLLI